MNEKRHRVLMISVNDTQSPRTGGEYVYKVIKDELLRRNYTLHEISVPIILKCLLKRKSSTQKEKIYRILLHLECIIYSFFKRYSNCGIIITSAHPAFPVFGHLVYHQPKSGIKVEVIKRYIEPYWRIGWIIVEKGKLSPLWYLASRSHVLHLSNSYFTKRLVKELYGIDSFVLYPPVNVQPLLRADLDERRKHGIIVAKPEVLSGITLLPKIAQRLPKNIPFMIIGRADEEGLRIIHHLRKSGFNINYLGYVSEQEKVKIFHTYSHYLHLGFNETFGITVVEAMASGCIPIAPKSGGIPEYLPEKLLFTTPAEAAEKILDKIGIDDIKLKINLRDVAIKFDEKRFRHNFMRYFKALENFLTKR
ncbi:MAG: glycosyltransferase [Candidatus Bathyarchaeia archaeon]